MAYVPVFVLKRIDREYDCYYVEGQKDAGLLQATKYTSENIPEKDGYVAKNYFELIGLIKGAN